MALRELLYGFYWSNRCWPEMIIFYRYRVSWEHYSQILKHDLKAIQKACASLPVQTKITLVAVHEKHHTHLFNGLGGNVMELLYVLHDDKGFSADRLQCLSLKKRKGKIILGYICKSRNLSFYRYGRDTRSTSTVASIYYARLAAERARCYIQAVGSERLPSVPTLFEKQYPMFYC